MILDMFGVLLHNLKEYSIVLHLGAITFAICIVQLYKETRLSHIRNGPLVFPEDEIANNNDGNKSDNTANQGTKSKKTMMSRLDRGKTVVGSKIQRSTVIGRIRDKTIGVKNRLQE
jgi:hypothetical protein